MHTLHTVTRTETSKVVPDHYAREAATNGLPDHINKLNTFKRVRPNYLTHSETVASTSTPKLTNESFWLALSFRHNRRFALLTPSTQRSNMATHSTRNFMSGTITEPQLHCIVAIPFGRANLQNNARTSLNDCHRHYDTIGIINLRHPNFST
jgi:hypothetical protein